VYTRPEDLERPRAQPQQAPRSLVGLIALLMLCLLLADIALRRGLLAGRWSQLRRAWLQPIAARVRFRPREPVKPVTEPPTQEQVIETPDAASVLAEAKRRARQRRGR
jgi:hypothetical protein